MWPRQQADWDAIVEGTDRAFSFASPENQAATGPAAHFGRMVDRYYNVLVHSDVFTVYPVWERSHAATDGAGPVDEALFLVRVAKQRTTLDRASGRFLPDGDAEVDFFEWRLSRRDRLAGAANLHRAWLTDGVARCQVANELTSLEEGERAATAMTVVLELSQAGMW